MTRSAELYAKAAAEVDAAKKVEAEAVGRDLTTDEQAKILEHCNAAAAARKAGDAHRLIETTTESVQAQIPNSVPSLPPAVDHLPISAEVRDLEAEARHNWPTMGHFAMAVLNASQGNGADPRLQFNPNAGKGLQAAGTGMEQATGSLGGFLVPPAYSQQIWDGMQADPTNLLPLTDQYTIVGESLTFPAAASTSRADGSRPVRAYWIAEAATMTPSYPTFRQLTIEPQELAVLVYATNKLLKNASGLEQYLRKAAVDEIGFAVGDKFLNGNGVGAPAGILNAACKIEVAKETSQVADTILAANVLKMRARMHPRAWPGAVWLANADIYPQLPQLYFPVKNVAGTENVGGWAAPMWNDAAGTLLGKRVIFTEWNATLGDAGDLVLANLQYYATGVTAGISSDMSIHLAFLTNQTAFRFIYAVDGKPWLLSAMTPFKGSNTLSPFITLAARA